MKIIVHAPAYAAGRAADLAARELESGRLERAGLIGIIQGRDAFSIKLNKTSVSVWHSICNSRSAINPDKWDVVS